MKEYLHRRKLLKGNTQLLNVFQDTFTSKKCTL